MRLKISIIIPVYNVEEYVGDTIESVLRQTYKNMEILLINDGSTDRSERICKQYVDAYDYIFLFNQQNSGLSSARNAGIRKASGDYMIFLDSDDLWENNLLATVVASLQMTKNIDYLFFRHYEYFERTGKKIEKFLKIDPNTISQLNGLETLSYVLEKEKNFPWYACLAIVRKDFILKNNLLFEVGRSYEDVIWTPTILMKAINICFIDKALYVYRRDREGQITSQLSYKNLRDSIFVANYWVNNIEQLTQLEENRNQLINNVITRYYYAIWFSGFLNNRDRKLVWSDIAEHTYLLGFANTPIQRSTKVLLTCIGLPRTSWMFRLFIKTKYRLVKLL